jgi:tetratricopeptide (TPR) repeat protein
MIKVCSPIRVFSARRKIAANLTSGGFRRLRFILVLLLDFLKHSSDYTRQLLKVESPGVLRAGFKHSAHWAHPVAALFAFASDVIKPLLPHCTVWVFVAALIGLGCLLLMIRLKKFAAELGAALATFCFMTALLSVAVIGLQKIVGGEENGAFANLIPTVEELQKKIGLVETKLETIQQAQQHEAERAESRYAAQMERLDAGQRAILAALAREKGVPIAALAQILVRLGETTISNDPAEIERKLAQKADEYLTLAQQVRLLSGDDPKVRALQKDAEVALINSDFELARAKLRQAAEIDRSAIFALAERAKTRALDAAQSLDKSASAATLTLHYRAAADDLADAAKLVMPFDRREGWLLMTKQASALLSQGDEFGDNGALEESIGIYQTALTLISRKDEAFDWAQTQNNLGNAFWTLGERESGTARLQEAVAAYRAALEEETRERVPFDWAAAQNNLGNALSSLGERESGTARLQEAVAAYRAALEERTRERVPLDWAMTQNNLGTALWTLGGRESGTARLQEAVAAYRAALEERTRERVPLDWAVTQNNLGTALSSLGERESGTARLQEAVAAYRAALEEFTRDRVPLKWARTQTNLGTALSSLGGLESGTARLEEAVVAYRAALEEQTRERVPLDWARTQTNLGTALSSLGGRESGTARLREAVAAYRAALEERTRERVPLDWATTQDSLGNALSTLGERESGTARLEEAVAAYRAALEEQTRERVPFDWATIQTNLGTALWTLGERESGTERLEEAVAAYRAALEEWTRESMPLQWAMTQSNLGTALLRLGERESGTERLEEAVAAFDMCLTITNTAWPEERAQQVRLHRDEAGMEITRRMAK